MDLKQVKQLLESMTDQELLRLSPIESPKSRSPHPRQLDFLNLTCEEALFGGACAGGKTMALLMWLMEGIHVPGYSAVFFRRTYAQLVKSNDSPLTKSHELFKPLGGKYKASEYRWNFPSGASIEFGHLQHEMSVMDYQGPAYHRVAFDELTQFSESQYTYLFSRMRMLKDFPIKMGVRAASNPGGPGHGWVRARFITAEAEKSLLSLGPFQPSPRGLVFWPAPHRAFVPARVADNPSLDIEDYVNRLRGNLSPVLRQRLLNGDWSVVEDAVIRLDWLRYYEMQGEMLKAFDGDGKHRWTIDGRQCQRFAVVDTAGTSAQKAAERKGKPPSWSVCQIWDYWPDTKFLFLRHVWRDRVAWEGLKSGVRHTLDQWKPKKVLIENAHHGPPLAAELPGFTTELISTSPGALRGESGKPGKLERATQLLNKLEKGEVFLPRYNNQWLPELESEWLTWTGLEDETSDQIDAASYAARHAPNQQPFRWDGVITSLYLDFPRGRAAWPRY
jgi:phage terminase large subunit-like protein